MKQAVLITFSPIADDPRVRRLGDRLHADGWSVTGIGFSGGRASPPTWRIIEVEPIPAPDESLGGGQVERFLGLGIAKSLAPVDSALEKIGSPFATPLKSIRNQLATERAPLQSMLRRAHGLALRSWNSRRLTLKERMSLSYHRLVPEGRAVMDAADTIAGPALWVANDWQALPVAARGVARCGGSLCYDSHELAVEQYAEYPSWVKFVRPTVEAIESYYLPQVSAVSTVSPGIAAFLRDRYKLDELPLTVRNVPDYKRSPYRSAEEGNIALLYQGAVIPGRGLEALIESSAYWKPGRHLTIRGPGDEAYLQRLREAAGRLAQDSRVRFAEAVPVDHLVSTANKSDVGLMLLPNLSEHKRLALPNKLFEYMMAGLALVVTDLPEMRHLVEKTGAGRWVAADLDPRSIAEFVNSLGQDEINEMKRQSLEAARRYHFTEESKALLSAYSTIYHSDLLRGSREDAGAPSNG